MRVLVIDVAAEYGGALSILKNFIDVFRRDSDNEYIVCVSTLDFEDTDNVKFVKIPWVKRSRAHRVYFDSCYIKKLVRRYAPDKIFSLQNKGFSIKKIPQEVYFHNALFICEKRFSFKESRKLWTYQNVISGLTRRSLRFADRIIVQGEWIKKALALKWGIPAEKITVDRPTVNPVFNEVPSETATEFKELFYPAGFTLYKNHRALLSACVKVWNERGGEAFTLLLTGEKENAPLYLKEAADKYNIRFLGRLSAEEMRDVYCRSILVFPSYIETVGLPLMEARSLGRPILAADCDYAREAVGDGADVKYFNPFDTDELSRLITENVAVEN